ncbi:uncharacterized protein sS8_2206 [Methylocaldum marinum]|uniref:Lipoprotein n=1 Tax=Methylocaldum marinum TaxID=1432792 RepID=A0A250KR97_9GAMM|nr:hypothetical protein [Methylocaldum marinum]BBA34158.1 uncharacterized protein sS8_2206 [Methylocaldum marinum]
MKSPAFSVKTLWPAVVMALILASGCTSTPPAPPTEAKDANDFPTLARVEYVLQCMQEHGGQNYNNLYHCTCSVDKIASRMSYDEFVQAQTFTYGISVAGERGAEFRDPPESAKLRERYKEAKKYAQEACFPAGPENGTGK